MQIPPKILSIATAALIVAGAGASALAATSVQIGFNASMLTTFNTFTSIVTAWPEPGSGLLMAAGLACIAALRVRQA